MSNTFGGSLLSLQGELNSLTRENLSWTERVVDQADVEQGACWEVCEQLSDVW